MLRSYLRVLNESNFVKDRDYKVEADTGNITLLTNGSMLPLIEADHTKDPDHMKLKGLEANAMHIDEVDEIVQTAYEMAQSRVGRDGSFPAPPVTIVTMNPNSKWCKTEFYTRWKAGTLPSNIAVLEFTRWDSWSDQSRYEKLIASRPKAWVERYINNNWDFEDDIDSLFKYRYFEAAEIQKLTDEIRNARRSIGYDVAREGRDRSVAALWYGKTLIDISISKHADEEVATDDQALWLIKYMTQNAVIKEMTAVDAVGTGVGVVDHMKSKGLKPLQFKSGFAPTSNDFDKLRSEVIYAFARGLETGEIKIWEGCPFRNELISEAMAHNHKTTDKKLAVESKDDVKKRTGSLSPDIFDAVIMGLWPQLTSKIKKANIIF
ncbi:hypothetical protein DVS77_21595 [Mycolicibacterium moriokaense]|nr:hypothetical protein DVS77_21595 [Mycolicibacterium moriokaense]